MDIDLEIQVDKKNPHILDIVNEDFPRVKLLGGEIKQFLTNLNFHKSRENQNKRDLNYVADVYDDVYSLNNEGWVRRQNNRRVEIFYHGQTFIADGWYLIKLHNELMLRVIKKLAARSVLEVGSGRGNNILSMSLRDSSLKFTGIEYSGKGVANSYQLMQEPPRQIIPLIDSTYPENIKQLRERITFVENNAFAMPFADKSFDLSFTNLVLEQMPHQFHQALKEMRRVTKKYCVFLEPFKEANNPAGRIHLKRKDYFRFSYKRFAEHGLKPVCFYTNYPQKVKFQTGLLVAKVVNP